MDTIKLKNIIEAALLAAGGPLTITQIQALFGDEEAPERKPIKDVIDTLRDDYEGRGIEILEVASGYRIQVRDGMSQWLTKLWEERPPRYSRALMETLAIIAYRQPVTRGDIEEIRGVGVTTNIIRTMLERDWIKVVGHRDVPGKPAMFGTTREFLDYFSLKKLDDLPPLAELAQLEPMGVQLELGGNPVDAPGEAAASSEQDSVDADSDDAGDTEADDDDYSSDTELHEYKEEHDRPPGAVEPLVGLRRPGEGPPEPATVSSLAEARVAAAVDESTSDEPNDEPAEVVPLKTS